MLSKKLISLSGVRDKNRHLEYEGCAMLHMRLKSHTIVVFHFVQEADAFQMFGCGHRQGQDITNGFMEARVGSVTEGHGLVFVLQKILHVAHLMVYCDQVVHGHNCALFDPEDKFHGLKQADKVGVSRVSFG